MSDAVPSSFFLLRTPLIAFDRWRELADGVTAPTARDDELAFALEADRARVRQRLRALVDRPEVREALFVASPSLYEALAAWEHAPDSERGRKAERSLVRYVARMCGRATPFGLFAGGAVGDIAPGAPTRLRLADLSTYRRHSRLDMDYLFALCEALASDEELRRRLRYRPNSTLYRAAGRLRYVEARLADGARTHHLVAVEPSAHLDAALERARGGATLTEIVAAVAGQSDVDPSEARGFVDELVARQLLVSDLEPTITGPEPIVGILSRLEDHPAAAPLAAARDALVAIDETPLGAEIERYRKIAASLSELPVAAEPSRLFQVDLVTAAAEGVLGGAVLDEIGRAVAALQRMRRRRDPLLQFREAFVRRYEAALRPLVEVLDEEVGIGFGRSDAPAADASPLLDGLPFGDGLSPDETTTAREVEWGARERFLLRMLMAAVAHGEQEIALTDGDVATLSCADASPLPDSFAVIASLSSESSDALDAGRFTVYIGGGSGPSSADLFGRFCHGDARLHELVRAELRAEEAARPDALFAEIVHLPEGRIGNLLLRPLLRGLELPFLGASGAPPEQQLPLDDLCVTVDGDRVVLRSRRLGREIVPRLTSAHNHATPKSLGIYRFLCLLQSQKVAPGLAWDWGPLRAAPFLPRIVYGRVVLARARWQLHRAQLESLGRASADDRWRAVQRLRQELRLPRFVALVDDDNRLPVDLDQVLSVETFVQLVERRTHAVLVEMTPPERLTVRGPGGGYVHELVIPYRRLRPAATSGCEPSIACDDLSDRIERRMLPGSECLYIKLYAGVATVDELLRDVVAPLVDEMRGTGVVRDWFFLRYADPEWHLRLRFFGAPAALHDELWPRLDRAARRLLGDGKLWSAQLDTYHREIERYGGPVGMQLCERLFTIDSDAVIALLGLLVGDTGADLRWRLALLGIDRLLDDLGLELDAKHALVSSLRAGFAREHDVKLPLEKALGDRFRRERPALEALLAPALPPEHPAAAGRSVLDERSRRSAPVIAELRAAIAGGRVTRSAEALAGSLVHMHVNRLVRASARASELVLYDFLQRLYRGRRARRRD
jgi:thiopeptide-type bacteriocin biosynthesis protein